MKLRTILPLFGLLFFTISCDRKSCKTDNPIFLEHTYNDNVYKAELAAQIKNIGQENLRYWLHDYLQIKDSEYLLFYIQNDDLCAEILIKMNHWNNLEYIQENKGKGSFNAEFKGLRFEILANDSGNIEFIYTSVDRIID